MVRCLDGLAEIALTAGDANRCLAYADELLALAEANGLRELEAAAQRWRGEARLAEKDFEAAQAALSRAATLTEETGRVRLQMDTQTALARLLAAQGQSKAAKRHGSMAHSIAETIEKGLASSSIKAQFHLC